MELQNPKELTSNCAVNTSAKWASPGFISMVLAILTVLLFYPLGDQTFCNLDDSAYVYGNSHVRSGISGPNVYWAFTELTANTSYWHPLTWLSHMLDCEVFGLNAGRHKITSMWIHIANVLLVFASLRTLTRTLWRAAFVAALFAWHPLQVECVAWISERKELLCSLFSFITILLYTAYARRPSLSRYSVVLLSFLAALMCKPMAVSLPLILLVLDFWPLTRFLTLNHSKWRLPGLSKASATTRSAIIMLSEKIPLFCLSSVTASLAIMAQRKLGALDLVNASLSERVANAFVVILKYLMRMVAPVHLSVYYEHPGAQDMGATVVSIVVVVCVSFAAFRLRKAFPVFLFGWVWFLIAYLPVSGLLQAGAQESADRYTYFPFVGIYSLIVWGLWLFSTRITKQGLWLVVPATGTIVLGILITVTTRQISVWRNSACLWENAVRSHKDGWFSLRNLAGVYFVEGRFAEAFRTCKRALASSRPPSNCACMVGKIYLLRQEYTKAEVYLSEATHWENTRADALFCLGVCYQNRGLPDRAIGCYSQAGRVPSQRSRAFCALAKLYACYPCAEVRNPKKATVFAKKACILTGYLSPQPLEALALAEASQHKFDDAVDLSNQALRASQFTEPPELAQMIKQRRERFGEFADVVEQTADWYLLQR